MEQLKQQILSNLQRNGFPSKKVSLPTDKLFDAAERRGFSFNKLADQLRLEGIEITIEADRIIFSSISNTPDSSDFELGNLYQKAQEMMAKMSPEERENLMKQYQNMSEEEKASIMDKAKNSVKKTLHQIQEFVQHKQ